MGDSNGKGVAELLNLGDTRFVLAFVGMDRKGKSLLPLEHWGIGALEDGLSE